MWRPEGSRTSVCARSAPRTRLRWPRRRGGRRLRDRPPTRCATGARVGDGQPSGASSERRGRSRASPSHGWEGRAPLRRGALHRGAVTPSRIASSTIASQDLERTCETGRRWPRLAARGHEVQLKSLVPRCPRLADLLYRPTARSRGYRRPVASDVVDSTAVG